MVYVLQPGFQNLVSGWTLVASGSFLLYHRKYHQNALSIFPVLAVLFMGMFSLLYNFYPYYEMRLLFNISMIAYESLILHKVVRHKNSYAITIISLFCTIATGRSNLWLLTTKALAVYVYLPKHVYFSSHTKTYALCLLGCWSVNFFTDIFFYCDNHTGDKGDFIILGDNRSV